MGNICSKKNTDDDLDNDVNIYTGLDDKQMKAMDDDLKEIDDLKSTNPEYIDIEEHKYNVLE